MITNFFGEIRLFEILSQNLDVNSPSVYTQLLKYIDKYVKYKKIKPDELKIKYEKFLKQYSKDTKIFAETNKYPYQQENYSYHLSREDYDVALLLSTVFTQHRFDMMTFIADFPKDQKKENALVVGCGVGIEIELIKEHYMSIDAYDLEIDQFCIDQHQQVNFVENEFNSDVRKDFGDIYIIELLEHVNDPYKLIGDACYCMNEKSRLLVTLAINIPQFDHVINFDDYNMFEEQIKELGLVIHHCTELKHKHFISDINASNKVIELRLASV